MANRPLVSFVLATHNRASALRRTFAALEDCGLSADEREVIVVDNDSDDETRALLGRQPRIRPILLDENIGSCAKAIGAREALAPILMFLDDDSFPRPGCMHRMLSAFELNPTLGAAGFLVRLPNATQECSALPHVFVGCGVGLRAAAVEEVGGLDETFFMQAEEYDLTIRLMQAGYRVERFADLQVDHLKTPAARVPSRRVYYDIRNNLRLIGRYLPESWATIYRHDWQRRYQAYARLHGHLDAFCHGQRDGLEMALHERDPYRRWRMSPDNLEHLFAWRQIAARMEQVAAAGFRRIALIDVSKNLYPFVQGAREAGLQLLGICDDHLSGVLPGYRDVPIHPLNEAPTMAVDAYVVSNCSYVHARERARWLRARTTRPVFNWFPPPRQTTDSPLPGPAELDHPARGPSGSR